MNRDEIIRLREECDQWAEDHLQCKGEYHTDFHTVSDERFAALVAAAERERLAKALDHQCRGMSDYFEVKWIRELATALRRNP